MSASIKIMNASTSSPEAAPLRISFVIAALNEAPRIGACIARVRAADFGAEIIVVDGGSDDDTPGNARRAGARLIAAPRGRGAQLKAGAEAARGDLLVFLHADTLFPVRGAAALRAALADPTVTGGNFRVLFDGADGFARWLTGFYAWFRRQGLYYGDSVIFVRRALYHELGGIHPLALMEDYDFSRRLERHGGTVCIDDPPVVTSSRRFAGRHPIAIFAQWLLLHGLYHLHLPGRALARLYDSERQRTCS